MTTYPPAHEGMLPLFGAAGEDAPLVNFPDNPVGAGIAGEQWRLRKEMGDAGGTKCRCCGQHVQLYRRSLNNTTVRALAHMYRVAGTDWFHLPTVMRGQNRGDTHFLPYWGLIEEERTRRPDGGRAGWWRITQTGVNYLHRRHLIRKYALIYNSEISGFDGPMVGIVEALESRFEYDKLMNGLL